MPLGTGRILSDQMRRELADRGLDRLERTVQRTLAPAGQPSSVSMRTNSQLHQSTQNLKVSILVMRIDWFR